MSWPRARLPVDRFFGPDPAQKRIALALYESIADLPLICPHGHVNPRLFADKKATFGTPADLLIIPDHYVFSLLYSQGVPLESLGIPRLDGGAVERDHRQIWQRFADNFHLFRGTPSGIWLTYELHEVFGIQEKLTGATAQSIHDELAARLASPEFRPRALFDRFNIEVLCTTDFATDSLAHHRAIRASDWSADIRPTFRPDDVIHLLRPGWRQNTKTLSQLTGTEIMNYQTFVQALEQRRAEFKTLGAVATDHDGTSFSTEELSPRETEQIFQRALKGQATAADDVRFFGHMLLESARMSIEDGLVMQVHFGVFRNHNQPLFEQFGPDMGGDIPIRAEFTHNLQPLLNKYGNDPRLTLILFTLDESAYARELAPLAGHYPALKIGPPWWFHDSLNGMARYFEQIMETAGLYNTVGFNDDTSAFPSIPARHDVWRRASVNWLAGLVVRGLVDEEDAREMAYELAYGLAQRAYRFNARVPAGLHSV